MTTQYTQEQIEDVARIFSRHYPKGGQVRWMIKDFADLFAADNPWRCDVCGSEPGVDVTYPCLPPNEHVWVGFDRTRFLAACRLES